jgi:hypothetical protein
MFPSPERRPDRCFATADAATAAGYVQAATPRGDEVVDGVYLVPTGDALLARCRAAVARLGFAVPCPRLAPFNWLFSGGFTAPGLFVLTGGFSPSPPGYVGVSTGFGQPDEGHLNVWAIPARLFGPSRFDYCLGGRAAGSTSVDGHAAGWFACPEGSGLDGGHIDLRWRGGKVVYTVSIHGQTQVNKDLDIAVAEHLQLTSGA